MIISRLSFDVIISLLNIKERDRRLIDSTLNALAISIKLNFFFIKVLITYFIIYNIVRILRRILKVLILLIIIALNLRKRLSILTIRVAIFEFNSRRSATLRYRRERSLKIILNMLILRLRILLTLILLITYFVVEAIFV